MASFTPTIAGQMSGSIGAYTFSHNKGGPYVRLRANPVQPNSIYQQAVKGLAGYFATAWVTILTAVQRQAWETYAANVPRPKPGGGTQYLTGLAHFIRSNVARVQGGESAQIAAPVQFNVGEYTAPGVSVGTPPNGLTVNFNVLDSWVSETGARMLFYTSRAGSMAKNFFKGPFRVIAGIAGDLGTPPTSPATLVTAFPHSIGHKMWYRVNVCRSDGRLGEPIIGEIGGIP